ncbi:MAG: hypothetical protein A2287_03455 [Candidatus Melainabacteria bacterium RIFOXYA12_FULL_32_12]|nr:MAG: hypothetical protein A2287_03455 [Candidatus Melainabacteria bacterium RIFOXYA12_FULL_32_12]
MDNNELKEKIKHQKDLISQPIDFKQLEKDGLLKRVGKTSIWYEVSNVHLLPKHVSAQIVAIV